ncbi:conserved repeat domain protein [Paenibacillus algicola]|uniref:Conserved repeat domain protein n=1 Tax=Paenibacillus algicola TaxID=2565926 RepID=A0A4P8XG15_9BACL|nr:DUF11 domain-containing protein [Paenibacillus algicola]QCT01033.1 conserved repeat domain protein [Paenibacillus algicola]
MAVINRFDTTINGAITFTGNTIGLSKQLNTNNQGDQDAIGAMATPNPLSQVNDFPPGTTLNFQENAASAVLQLPAQSTVLYAELIWSGSYNVAGQDLSAFINDNVSFTTPAGSFSIPFDPATAATIFNVLYVRSADVTALVQAAGAGTYTVGDIVATTSAINNTTNSGGWTLMVAYQNPTLPIRNMSIFVASEFVSTGSGSTPFNISGFFTPTTGPVNGRLQVSSLEGDSNRIGDQLLFGPTVGTLTPVSGPNNPIDNFFASQINGDDGTLDTSGTFGNLNQPLGINADGRRQGYDITNIDVSPQLVNAQTDAVIQGTTSGDAYVINGVGLQIDVNAPRFEALKSADVSVVSPGDVITYTVEITNTGTADATVVVMFDASPECTTLVPNSVTVDGVPQPGATPANLPLGNIIPGQTVIVQYQLVVSCVPPSGQYVNEALFEFQFQSEPGGPILTGFGASNILVIQSLQQYYAINLAAIALAELSQAHIMNSEAEKLQTVLGTASLPVITPSLVNLNQLIQVNSSVEATLETLSAQEIVLLQRFEHILRGLSVTPGT